MGGAVYERRQGGGEVDERRVCGGEWRALPFVSGHDRA